MLCFKPGELMIEVLFYSETKANSEKENRSSRHRNRTYDFPISSLDALLRFRRLVGAKAIKLGSCYKHPAYC